MPATPFAPTDPPHAPHAPARPKFARFGRRITYAFVSLAVGLITLVAGASTVVSLYLYASSLDDALSAAAKRAAEIARIGAEHRQTMTETAEQILHIAQTNRIRIAVFATGDPRPITGDRPSRAGRNDVAEGVLHAAGLRPRRVAISGGVIFLAPDFDRFGHMLRVYWLVMLPVGLCAVAAALVLGTRITRSAVRPLSEVTAAMESFAGEKVQPDLVSASSHDLTALTSAYNDVARRIAAAFAERDTSELRMRRFIADAGHELRTPLTVVMGYLDLLEQAIIRDPEGVAHVYQVIRDECRRMRGLIEKLIFLARLERPSTDAFVEIDLADVVARAIAGLPHDAARARIALAAQTVVVMGEDGELYEIARNLIDNALKYASEGTIEVRVRVEERSGVLEVVDRGPGMTPEDLAHACDRFYRGASRGEIDGSGLGLAIVQRAAERMGGVFTLASAPGAGTTARVCLPLASRDAASESLEPV